MAKLTNIQERCITHLDEHGDTSAIKLAAAVGVSTASATKALRKWRDAKGIKAKPGQRFVEADGATTEEVVEGEEVDASFDDTINVQREYLTALEALRDQVIENARLRRVIGDGQ